MVKHMSITKVITNTNLEAFGAWLREPEVYAKYHKGFNKNDNIQLTPWKLDGRSYNREVVAYLPVKAPAWFRKAIGTDQIRVKEFQCATFEHDSAPSPQAYETDAHPRDVTAVLFTTQLCFFPPWKDLIPFLSVQLRYSDALNGVKVRRLFPYRCGMWYVRHVQHVVCGIWIHDKVDASLSCTAEGLPWLWVLHGAIEKIMLGQARDNITALIDFFQREVSAGALNKQPQQQQQQEPSSPPEGDAVHHHLADVSGVSNAQEEHREQHPANHGPAYPDSPTSVYFDAEEDAFSTDDVLSIKEVKLKRKKQSTVRRLLCCFSPCCMSDNNSGSQPPSQVHLLE